MDGSPDGKVERTDGRQAMTNQLLAFALIDRMFDDGGREDRDVRDLLLPLMLCSSTPYAGQVQSTAPASPAMVSPDYGNPLQLILLLALLRRRPQEHINR